MVVVQFLFTAIRYLGTGTVVAFTPFYTRPGLELELAAACFDRCCCSWISLPAPSSVLFRKPLISRFLAL